MSKNAKRAVIALFLIAALGGGAAYRAYSAQKTETTASAEYTPITIQKGDLEDAVTAQGKLEPREYVDVGAQVSGQLSKIHVEIGDVVKKGDLIAEIDPKIYTSRVEADEARVKTLSAQIDEQQANLTLAGQKHERNQQLIKSKAISAEALEDTATANTVEAAKLAALKAQLEEQQSTLNGDKANLGYTKIYAPMDGTIVLQPTREGQTLNASQSAPVVVQVADLDIMTVRAQVAEADVMRLKAGMPVYFTTLGSPRKWQGNVRQILPAPEVINDVVLYNVLVDVDNKDRQLMTGMSTQLFFIVGKAEGVPLIPVAALGKRLPAEDNDTGTAYQVDILSGKAKAQKTIRVGLMDRKVAEVKEGLAAGDIVAQAAAAPVKKTPDGMRAGGPRL